MTRNLYVGANFGAITGLDPTDPLYLGKLVEAVTTVYYTMLVQNDFHVRVAGIVNEIVANRPDLVGLQEVSTLRLQSPGDRIIGGTTPANDVVIDYLQVLMEALADRGAHYAVVCVATNLDAELPMLDLATGGIDDVRVTDHDVILARKDLPPGYLRLSNPAQGNFQASLVIPSIGLEIKRGWCSVDAFVRGRTFRFINMHLEEEIFPDIQWLQAQEVLAGPANVCLPVILVGDGNTDGNRQNGTWTYDGLLGAGFKDSWNMVHPRNPGLTWGHDPFLADPSVPFVWRIDLILYRNRNCLPLEASVLDTHLRRRQPPFWPSDHAGVVARFLLK
jgi:endonuclease/exonuclease/phosphatase family metal-dependent hydrolase